MRDILTITLNPAVDLSTETPTVEPDRKLRCERAIVDPGGGGINVSRAIRILGGQTRALVALGGPTGEKLRYLLLDEGIAYLPFQAPGETRQSLAVTEQETGQQFRFVMPGPDWDEVHQTRLLSMLPGVAPDEGVVVVSGSQPPGVPNDFTIRVCSSLGKSNSQVIADIYGAPLAALVQSPPENLFALRMDQDEAETLNGNPLATREDTARFAKALVAQKVARLVIVARGADGSVLASEETVMHATAVEVPIKSKVGAGDSFVGAFALSVARGEDYGVALQRATAAASSAVTTSATQLCTREDAERFLGDCRLSVLKV